MTDLEEVEARIAGWGGIRDHEGVCHLAPEHCFHEMRNGKYMCCWCPAIEISAPEAR
jgi:hypothetical protein